MTLHDKDMSPPPVDWDKPVCDPLNLDSHDWQPFGRQQTLLKCAREGCGIVTSQMLFKLPRAHLP